VSVLYFLLLVGVLVVSTSSAFAAAKLLDVRCSARSATGARCPFQAPRDRVPDRAFPIGGYVRILGVEGDGATASPSKADARRSFAARPLWQRLVIVFAGPASLVLPIIIYCVLRRPPRSKPSSATSSTGALAAHSGVEPAIAS
jgi:regulator of sigma E protease